MDTIHLGLLLAWNSGKWWGSMDRLIVKVVDRRIVLPAQYGVLLAINYNGIPEMIHPVWYEFSPNGPGTKSCWDASGVFDLQMVATEFKVLQGEHVCAVSKSKIGEDLNTSVIIQGLNSDIEEVYRYCTIDDCGVPIRTSNAGEEIKVSALMENGQPSPAFATSNAWSYDGITAILKEPTVGPIDIMAVGPRYARRLVTLSPGQRQSDLRAYHIPPGCNCNQWVEVLVKKAEPERPHLMDEILPIKSPNALIDLCLSVYYSLDSGYDPQRAALYLTSALGHLNGQLQENLQASQGRPSVWVGASHARNKARNRVAY